MGNVAINGFGRIGRSILRIIVENDSDINVVAINDLGNYENLAYLLKHDSVMGILDRKVSVTGNKLIVDDRTIQLTSIKDPAELPWKEMDVDVVVESTGIFRDSESLNKHLDAGAKKVLLTVPPKDDIDATIVPASKWRSDWIPRRRTSCCCPSQTYHRTVYCGVSLASTEPNASL